MSRDRDAAGRARNARPRDASGRPLPPDAQGEAQLPDDAELGPDETLREAQRLLDEGYPFYAHEVLEAAWKAAGAPERDLWQGLAQLAVGLTHVQRDNPTGASALLRRGAGRIEPYARQRPYGLDVAALAARATELAERVEQYGLDSLGPGGVRLSLRLR